ncbi:MAG TPA: DUF2516 family protein [Nocardioidaceae bacterium]|nr:DUF2516 family protein [Nocardioidaceae bacterium]
MLWFEIQSGISLIVYFAIFIVEAFALIDAVSRPAQAYLAADKWNKQAWTIVLGLSVLVQILLASPMLQLIGLVAALVYVLDARPALKSVTRRR